MTQNRLGLPETCMRNLLLVIIVLTYVRPQCRWRKLSEYTALSLLVRLDPHAAQTTEALLPFFLAMVTYPEVQRKCHAELDAVVGRSRMPVFEDRDNLPYLKATVRELLRWRPISPLGGFSMRYLYMTADRFPISLGTEHVTKEVKMSVPSVR